MVNEPTHVPVPSSGIKTEPPDVLDGIRRLKDVTPFTVTLILSLQVVSGEDRPCTCDTRRATSHIIMRAGVETGLASRNWGKGRVLYQTQEDIWIKPQWKNDKETDIAEKKCRDATLLRRHS